MNLQRITIGLVVLLIAGLAGSFYMNWRTLRQLQITKAFVESAVFAEAVTACEKAQEVVALLQQQRYALAGGTAALHLFGSLLLTVLGIKSATLLIAGQ